ncbi:MAG: hypothetical protein ACYCVZ_16300, partial [Streptosporangiaceae bacterium]
RTQAGGPGSGRRPGSEVADPADEHDFTDGGDSRARRRDREDEPARAAGRLPGDRRTSRPSDRAGTDRAGTDPSRAGRADGRRSPARGAVDSGPLPEIRPRAGRNKKDSGDWPSGEWEQLSDADYWAELAADRPLTEPARPSSGRADAARADAARAGGGRANGGRADGARADGGRADGARRDGRPDRIDAAAREIRPRERISRPRHDEAGYGTAVGGYGSGRAEYDRIEAADRTISMPASRIARTDGLPEAGPATRRPGRVQPGSDDDPLTRPSFPRITVDDGRSYRRSRSDDPSRQAAASASYPGASYPEAGPSGRQDHPSWPSAGSADLPVARQPGRPGDARARQEWTGQDWADQDWAEQDRRGDGRAHPDRAAADRGGWTGRPDHAQGDGARRGPGQHGPGQRDEGRYGGHYVNSQHDGAGYREAAPYPAAGMPAMPSPSGGYGPAAPAVVAYSAGDSGGYGYPGSDYSGSDYSGSDYSGSDYSGSDYSGSDYSGSAYAGSGYPAAGYYAAPYDEAAADPGSYGTGSYHAGPQDVAAYGEPHYADAAYGQDPGYPQPAPFARDERAGYDPYAADPYGRPGYGS